MELNGTLIVQIIHFLLIYYLLRSFLFKPVLAEITNEKEEHDTLTNTIHLKKKTISEKEKERIVQWEMIQKRLQEKMPPCLEQDKTIPHKMYQHSFPSFSLSEAETQEIVNQLMTAITKETNDHFRK